MAAMKYTSYQAGRIYSILVPAREQRHRSGK